MKTTIKEILAIITSQFKFNSTIAESNGLSLLGYLSRNDYPEITRVRENLYGSACLYYNRFNGALNL